MTVDGAQRAATTIVGAILAILIVGGAVLESVTRAAVEPSLLVMATAVIGVFFTGQAVRQVNGTKVDALTQAVLGMHTRLDTMGAPAAKDGTTLDGQG